MGHVVSSEGIAADPAKIEKVVNWPVPTYFWTISVRKEVHFTH